MGYYLVMVFLCFFFNEADGEITIIHVWVWEFIILGLICCLFLLKEENDENDKKK